MFVKNKSEGYIPSNEDVWFTHEGFEFRVPPGVCAIWDSAGEVMMANYGKIDSPGGKDRWGYDNGRGIPPLQEAKKVAWTKDGKKLAEVRRYKINPKLIPRNKLIIVALERGIDRDRVTEYQIDSTIDIETIANEINALPVPEHIKRPVDIEENDDDNVDSQED